MSIHEKFSHINQLAQWWENAEKGVAQKGDTVIHLVADDCYNVFPAFESDTEEYDEFRILARAPKPAWHGAVAVMARLNGAGIRHALIRDGRDRWITMYGGVYMALELSDVTPLIEAKVTDEMVERAVDAASVWTSAVPDSLARAMLTAALGIEDGDV